MSKFPPRVWLTLWPADGWSHGAQYTHAYRIRKFEEDLEYLSIQEHEHLLEAAQAEAAALRDEVKNLKDQLEAVMGFPEVDDDFEDLASTERGGEVKDENAV